jgi:hypothetical protein
MSLFQLTLILGGILFRKPEHRQEHMNLGAGAPRRQAVLETASRFAGAGELKNACVETCIRRYEQYESS